ncbi:MAG TPA: ferrous iron transport protein B [Firmicutes bacterium]|nr:ferrous iron transport protein B [Bacillota bacterium]
MTETVYTVALAGNPNVGKSTLFNALTGLNQHTGNWAGKTVDVARGRFSHRGAEYRLIDLPGMCSMKSDSAEEKLARDFIAFEPIDAAVVVADATSLERGIRLTLEVMEATPRVLLCVNLMDEAAKKGIRVNIPKLHEKLGIPVVPMSANRKKGIREFKDALRAVIALPDPSADAPLPETLLYDTETENALMYLQPYLAKAPGLNTRFAAICLLEGSDSAAETMAEKALVEKGRYDEHIRNALAALETSTCGFERRVARQNIEKSASICRDCVRAPRSYTDGDRRVDRILSSKVFGLPILLLLFGFLFWLTAAGANYPSQLLMQLFTYLEGELSALLTSLGAPEALRALLAEGAFRTTGWVVAVMLPPMAIFFPLFTLLEDVGFLPRLAFNVDRCFRRSQSCGKQALTMCMGIGCNACGVTGCRIIESRRERACAIVTNAFMPCNGRFPILIALLSMFLASSGLVSALWMLGFLLLAAAMTLLCTFLLSRTLWKNEPPSAFLLELPPYRVPQIGRVLVRSLLDRTLLVLRRAVCVALPAGVLIWLLANAGDGEALRALTGFFDPIGRFFGLDGVILTAFLLALPANELVMPLLLLIYADLSSLTDLSSLEAFRTLLIANGWTAMTALSVCLLVLFHSPCATTLLTIRRETGSTAQTLLAVAVPSAVGLCFCLLLRAVGLLF